MYRFLSGSALDCQSGLSIMCFLNILFVFAQVMEGLHVSCVSALVLDEDGTGVDTEDFFQTLRDNTVLVVLEKG